MMDSKNIQLLEAVASYNKADEEFRRIRTELADLLLQLSHTQQVTNLARMTGINRTTIYWLMRTWSSDSANSGQEYNGRAS